MHISDLTPKKYQSGETDVTGRISKIGDGGVRTALYEAANVILTRPVKGFCLEELGNASGRSRGMRKAKVALARKLAVVLHRTLADPSDIARRNCMLGHLLPRAGDRDVITQLTSVRARRFGRHLIGSDQEQVGQSNNSATQAAIRIGPVAGDGSGHADDVSAEPRYCVSSRNLDAIPHQAEIHRRIDIPPECRGRREGFAIPIPPGRKHTIGGAIGRPRHRGFSDKPVKSADDCFSLLSHSPTLRFPRPLSTVLATQRRESGRDRAATEPHGAAIGDLRLGLRQRGKAIIIDPEVTRSSEPTSSLLNCA